MSKGRGSESRGGVWRPYQALYGATQIQRGTISITSPATSATATISSVDTTSARVRFLAISSSNTTSVDIRQNLAKLTLTNATTVTADRSQGANYNIVVSYEVEQYAPELLRQPIQTGTINMGAVTSATATITAVDVTKAQLEWAGTTTSGANADMSQLPRLELTNATTVTVTRVGNVDATGVNFSVMEVN